MSHWARRIPQGWLLSIHVQPGSKTVGIAGVHGEALKVRVASRPERGRANVELLALLANLLGVPKGAVTVVKGEASRRKVILVARPQADPERLLQTTDSLAGN